MNKAKIEYLTAELKKYEERLRHMETEFAATKSGSAHGVEYYDIQCKVYADMIYDIKLELMELKKKKS